MTTPIIVIPGLSNATKRPAFYGQIVNPAGALSNSSIPLLLLLVGNKTSAGNMTADAQPVQVTSVDDVDFQAGPGSELACMAYGIGGTGAQGGTVGGAFAVAALLGVPVFLAAVTEASAGPVAATATITIAGSWTAGGTLRFRLSGVPIFVNVGPNDTPTNVAVNICNAINGNARLPFTAGNIAGAVTLTTKNLGLRNNWHSLYKDMTAAPAGLTATLAGGAAMTGGGFHFTGGAGSDSPSALLANIVATQYDRIAYSCGDNTLDTTNIALWKTQLNNQSAPTSGILQQLVIASNDTLTNAASIAQTTLNNTRFQVLHGLNIETHPSVVAAIFAATRCGSEQIDPNAYYDSKIAPNALPGVAPQTQNVDRHTATTEETALGEGVTPLLTFPDGSVRISRAITTYCKNGSNPDYRVLDTNQTTVPDFVLQDLGSIWTTSFLPNNPNVEDNAPTEIKSARSGVATPNDWSSTANAELQNLANGVGLSSGLPILDLNQTLANPVVSVFVGGVTPRIMSAVSIVPAAKQHIIGVSVRNVTQV